MAAGDVTYTHPAGAQAHSAFASGSLTCDADTAINVLCGFQPTMIELHYKDSGATTVDAWICWFAGMTAANYWKVLMSTGVRTLETSGGPIVYAGSGEDGYTEGFTVPAGLMDNDADTIYWIAWR
jgi:hypothetical protein